MAPAHSYKHPKPIRVHGLEARRHLALQLPSNPLVLSLQPPCQGACGSANHASISSFFIWRLKPSDAASDKPAMSDRAESARSIGFAKLGGVVRRRTLPVQLAAQGQGTAAQALGDESHAPSTPSGANDSTHHFCRTHPHRANCDRPDRASSAGRGIHPAV